MSSVNNNESSKQTHLDNTDSDIHHVNKSIAPPVNKHASLRQDHTREILATIPRLSTAQIGQQTTKKTLRSLRLSTHSENWTSNYWYQQRWNKI